MKTCFTVYSWGGIPHHVLGSYIDLAAYIVKEEKDVEFHTIADDALISRSRCRSTQRAIKSGCDVWVQLDHDLTFDPVDIFRMAELAYEKKAAVCIPYSCRAFPPAAAIRHKDNPIDEVGYDELLPITFFASGCVAIPIKEMVECIDFLKSDSKDVPEEFRVKICADNIVGEFPSLWQPMITETKPGKLEYLSEDYSASARLNLAGMDQVAWVKPQLKHWGEHGFSLKKRS